MIIKKGDYTFCGEDTRPHRWAIKVGKDNTIVQLNRMSYADLVARSCEKLDIENTLGTPLFYYVADDGGFATVWPRADKDYELVQLSDKEETL